MVTHEKYEWVERFPLMLVESSGAQLFIQDVGFVDYGCWYRICALSLFLVILYDLINLTITSVYIV